MTALDQLRRAELRQAWSRRGGVVVASIGLVAAAVGAGIWIHRAGVSEGRSLEQHAAFARAVSANAAKLASAVLHRDSTKQEATIAVKVAATHRDTSAGTIGRVQPTKDGTLQIDSLPPIILPKVAIDAYRDLLEGRQRDSVALAKLAEDNAALFIENQVISDRVGLFEEHEATHEAEVKVASHQAFWRGVKVGGFVATLIGAALAIAR